MPDDKKIDGLKPNTKEIANLRQIVLESINEKQKTEMPASATAKHFSMDSAARKGIEKIKSANADSAIAKPEKIAEPEQKKEKVVRAIDSINFLNPNAAETGKNSLEKDFRADLDKKLKANQVNQTLVENIKRQGIGFDSLVAGARGARKTPVNAPAEKKLKPAAMQKNEKIIEPKIEKNEEALKQARKEAEAKKRAAEQQAKARRQAEEQAAQKDREKAEAEKKQKALEKKAKAEAEKIKKAEAKKAKAEAEKIKKTEAKKAKQEKRKAARQKILAMFAGLWKSFKKSLHLTFKYLIYFAIVYFAFIFYIAKSELDKPFLRALTRYLPIPAYIVNGKAIDFYFWQDLKKQTIPDNEKSAAAYARDKLARYLAMNELAQRYGLPAINFMDMEKDIVKKALAEKAVFDESANQVAIKRINSIKEMISKENNFISVSEKYGDEVGRATITMENKEKHPYYKDVENLAVNEISDIAASANGYYIFRCFEKSAQEQVLSYVLVKSKNIDELLNEMAAGYKFKGFIE